MTDAYQGNPFASQPQLGNAPPPVKANPKPETGYDKALKVARSAPAYTNPDLLDRLTDSAMVGLAPDLAGWGTRLETEIANATGQKTEWTPEEMQRATYTAQKEALAKYAKDHPNKSKVADVFGWFLTPGLSAVDKKLAQAGVRPVLRAMGIGAAVGGAAGYGYAEGNPTERLKAVPQGAAFGEGLGATFHGAGNLVSGFASKLAPAVEDVAGRVSRLLAPAEKKPELRAEAAKTQARQYTKGVLGDEGQARLKAHVDEGRGETAGEVGGRRSEAELHRIAQHDEQVSERLESKVTARNRAAGDRVAKTVATAGGLDSDSIVGDFRTANKARRATAGPLYEKFYGHGGVDSPELEKFAETPQGQKAIKTAVDLIKGEHGDPYKEGLLASEVPLMMMAGDRAEPHTAIDPVTGEPKKISREDAIKLARSQGFAHPAEFERQKPSLTAKGWDYVKRGLDDQLEEFRDKTTGKLDLSSPRARVIMGLRTELRDALIDPSKPHGPDAAAAFKAGGDAPRQEEAFGRAKSLMAHDVPDHKFDEAWGQMDDEQHQALKAGVANMARDAAQAGPTEVRKLIQSWREEPHVRYKLDKMFGKEGTDKIIEAMESESRLIASGKRLTPQFNPSEGGKAKHAGSAMWHIGLSLLAGHPLRPGFYSLMHFLRGMQEASQAIGGGDQAMMREVGELLSKSPKDLAAELEKDGDTPEFAQKVNEFLDKIRNTPELMEQIHTGAGRVGGRIAGKVSSENANESRYDQTEGATVGQPQKGVYDDNPFANLKPGQQTSPPSEKQASPSSGQTPDIYDAIGGQEWSGEGPAPKSIDGAVGPSQIRPETAERYGLDPDRLSDPAYAEYAKKAIINHISMLPNVQGDPARIAVGYFSGEGNIAPQDSDTPFLHDRPDGNGKMVSAYVSDVLKRMGLPVNFAVDRWHEFRGGGDDFEHDLIAASTEASGGL